MLLTFLLLLPFVGGFVILTIPYDKNNLYRKRIKIAGLITSIIIMIITLLLYIGYDSSFNHFQYVEDFNEIKLYDIYLGLDGASIYFVLLTSIIIPISLLSNYSSITKDIKLYIIIILLLELLLLTVFIVLDGLSYYIFFESILGPLFVLIGIYGSKGRVRACFYLFLYTLLGSLFLLLSILSMSSTTGYTDYDAIFKSNYDWLYQLFLFYGVFIAFAVKTPTIFLNTWLLKAHVESPLAGSIVLAAIVLKLSLYGVLRFILTLLAKAALHMTSIVYTIGVISIFYASYSTIRTIDVKELIAYSSVSHAVVYLMAVFSNTIQGIEGGILLGLAHGLTSSGLFICVGGILYDRTHTRVIYFYRGLAQIMPLFAILFFILSLGNSGVPLTLNFLGEFLSLYGIFERLPALGVFASSSIIFSAAYTIFMYNRISFAGSYSKYFQLYIPDLFKREYTILSTLVLFIIILGLYPSCILDGLHYDISKLLYGIDCIHYCVDDSNSDDLKDKPTAILDNMEIIEEKFTKCKINFLDTDENLKDNSTTEIYYDSDSDENMKDLKDLENMKDLKDLENMKDLKDLENEINLQDKKVEVLVELINSVFSFLLFLLYALLRIITGDKGDKGDKSQQGPENGPDREILLTINTSEIKPYNSGEIDSILNGKKYHVCMKKDDNAVEIENQAKVSDNNSNINTYEEQTSPATTSREINRNPNERDIYTSTTEFNTGQDEIAIDTTVTFPASNLENESLQDDLSQGELGDTEKFYSDDEDKMDETTKYDREFAKQLQYDLDRNLDRDVTDISIQEKLVQDKEIQKQVQTDAELAKNLAVMEEKGYKDNKSLAKRIQREEELETTAKSGATNKRRKIVSSASYAESSVNATARGTRINASNEETQPSQSTQRQEIPQTLSTQRQEIPQIQPTQRQEIPQVQSNQRQEIPQVQSNQAMENKSPQSSLSGESSDKWAGPTDISDTSDDTIFSSDSRTDDPDSPYENYY